ncbi:hypothetical protein [Pseudocitrobacter cyperus]|uniref:Lipoprotein n=1 Tax=Pseudocitrobacter cyperus TaxID=3112843 RepID=A0ABV0HG25_9ENTR
MPSANHASLLLSFTIAIASLTGCIHSSTDMERNSPRQVSEKKFTDERHPLPYTVKLSSTTDDRMLCDNCGNAGQQRLIQGGEKLSQYNMMVDSPYYAFLCIDTPVNSACRAGQWVMINKNQSTPRVEKISIGGTSAIADLRPANDKDTTWLEVIYANGEKKVFALPNTP